MRSQHIWTEKDAEGRKREVRVTKFGGVWRVQAKYADEPEWTYYDRPLLDDLLKLKDVVFRKYQRRRAASEDLESIESYCAASMRRRTSKITLMEFGKQLMNLDVPKAITPISNKVFWGCRPLL